MFTNVENIKKENLIFHAMPWVIFLVFMQVASDRMFNTVTPVIADSFAIDAGTVSLLITVASLVMGVGGAVYGALADIYSPKKLFVAGAILFASGSVLGFVFQFSFPLIVLARAVQCMGAAVVPGCFVVLVRRYMDAENQAKYLGINTAMYQLSAGLGALLGGYVADYIAWPFIFLVPVIVLLFIPFYIKYLPDEDPIEESVEETSRSIDFMGIGLLALFVGTLLFGINENSLTSLIISIFVALVYGFHALRSDNPIMDVRLFKTPKLISGTLVGCGVYGVQAVVFFMFAFMMTAAYNLPASTIGLMYIPANFAGFLAGMLSGNLAKKVGVKNTFYIGTALITTSLLMFSFLLGADIAFMWIAFALFGVGYATIYAGYYTVFTKELPRGITGRAMAVRNLTNTIITAIMITIVGNLVSSDLLTFSLLPSFAYTSEMYIYANITFILAIIVIISVIGYSIIFKSFEESESVDEDTV